MYILPDEDIPTMDDEILKFLDFETPYDGALESHLLYVGLNLSIIEDLIQHYDSRDVYRALVWVSSLSDLESIKLKTLAFLFISSLYTLGAEFFESHSDEITFGKMILEHHEELTIDIATEAFWNTIVQDVFVDLNTANKTLRPLLEGFWQATDRISQVLLISQIGMLSCQVLHFSYEKEIPYHEINFTDYVSLTMNKLREAHVSVFIQIEEDKKRRKQ